MAVASSSVVVAPPRSSGNFAGTVALAMCALGLTLGVYITNWRRARSSGSSGDSAAVAGGGKGDSGVGGEAAGAGGAAAAGAAAAGGAAGRGGPLSLRDGKAPLRGYHTINAELHTRRPRANLWEWADECLGVVVPFSPTLFSLLREERQAPMALLSMQYLREPSHGVSIAIEELHEAQDAATYREASLSKLVGCSRVLSSSTLRVASTNHPSVEHCYLDMEDRMNFVLSVFRTHGRLALTIQYTAPTRVRGLLPTAFYELVRSVSFPKPRPSPSYLLVSEPRLGLGFRLPVDFAVHEGGGDGEADVCYYGGPRTSTSSAASGDTPRGGLGIGVGTAAAAAASGGGGVHGAGAVLSSPFATAVGRGTRRMAVIAAYEPSAPVGVFGAGPWPAFLERHLQVTVQRLGLRLDGALRLVFRDGPNDTARDRREDALQPGQVSMRPYHVTMSGAGNFGLNEDDDDDDENDGGGGGGGAGRVVTATGAFCLHKVSADAGGPCQRLLRATAAAGSGGVGSSSSLPVYLGVFYIPIRDECFSFTFVASAARHHHDEFVGWCTAAMQSVSLRNHLGQGTSLLYCNVRHDIMPFTVALTPGTQTVDEPQLGDPIALLHSSGAERTTAVLRVFPLLRFIPASSSGTGTPLATSGGMTPRQRPVPAAATAMGAGNPQHRAQRERRRQRTQLRALEHMLRGYLGELPEAVSVLHWERCSIRGMAAMRFCFEQSSPYAAAGAAAAGAGGSGSGSLVGGAGALLDDMDGSSAATSEWLASRSLMVQEEIGTMNPFSRYYAPPAPELAYIGLGPAPPPAAKGRAKVTGAAADGEAGNASFDSQGLGDLLDDPLRAGVAVCVDGYAFMFIASASAYSLGAAQQMVQDLATRFAVSGAAA